MPKYHVHSPIKTDKGDIRDGIVELSAKDAASALSRGELSLVKETAAEKTAAGKAAAEKAAAEKAAADKTGKK